MLAQPTSELLHYVLFIHSAPYTQGSYSALRFAEAALQQGHHIEQIFFYHDAVQHANNLAIPPTDEHNIAQDWEKLAAQYQFNLMICIAAALRRGVLDKALATQYEKAHFNLAKNYQIVGLGQFIEATLKADRVLVFGNQL